MQRYQYERNRVSTNTFRMPIIGVRSQRIWQFSQPAVVSNKVTLTSKGPPSTLRLDNAYTFGFASSVMETAEASAKLDPRTALKSSTAQSTLFKGGPLAWNGVFAWWIPLCVYFGWFVITVVLLLRAINDDEREQRLGAQQNLVSHNHSEPATIG
jgi:hypothetical protein